MTPRYAIWRFQVHTQHTLYFYCFFHIYNTTHIAKVTKSHEFIFLATTCPVYNRYREQSEEPELGKQAWPQMTYFLANKEYANNLGKYCFNYLNIDLILLFYF